MPRQLIQHFAPNDPCSPCKISKQVLDKFGRYLTILCAVKDGYDVDRVPRFIDRVNDDVRQSADDPFARRVNLSCPTNAWECWNCPLNGVNQAAQYSYRIGRAVSRDPAIDVFKIVRSLSADDCFHRSSFFRRARRVAGDRVLGFFSCNRERTIAAWALLKPSFAESLAKSKIARAATSCSRLERRLSAVHASSSLLMAQS